MSGQDSAHNESYNANESLSVPGRKEVENKGSDFLFDMVCDPCLEENQRYVPFGFCSDCNHFLCEKCYSVHCRPLPTRNHKLLDKDHMPESRPHVSINYQVIDERCEKHNGKIVEYYCEHHRIIGCSVCITLDHKACDGVQFVPEMKVDKDKVHLVMKELSSLNMKAKDEKDCVKQSLAIGEESFDIAVQNARRFCRKTKTFMDILESKFEETAERERDALVQAKSLEIDNLEKTIQLTESFTKDMSCYHLANKEARLFIAMKKAEQFITLKSYDNDHKTFEPYYTFVPHQDLCMLQNSIEILGEIQEASKPSDKKGEIDESNLSYIGINIENESSGYYGNAKEDTSDCIIVGIVSLFDPIRDVIADAGNNKIKVIKGYSNTLTTSLNISSRPFAMAKFSDNKVCVTMPERKEIVVISISKLFRKDTISKTKTITCRGKCYGIAVNEVHDEIVVVCEHEESQFAIDILDFNGKKLRHFTGKESNDEPRYIEVTNDHIYTLDINNGVMKKMLRMAGVVETIFTVENALHFTVLKKQYLIVVTGTKQILRVFDLNFNELKVKGELNCIVDKIDSIVCIQKESIASDSLNVGFSNGYVETYQIKK